MVKLRRISVVERYILEFKDLTLEAKKDLEDLKDYLGDDLFDSYMKIRDKISDPSYKDFSKLKKMDKKDIQDFISSFQSKSDKKKKDKQEGADKLYEDDEWVVYKITTYPAAQLYGKGTKWCITGRYPGHEERGQKYFDEYIENNNLDGGYYFYLNKKDPSEKYCVLQTKDEKIHSIWDSGDTNKGSSMSDIDILLPEIKEVNLRHPNKDELLINACRKGDLYKVQFLLKNGANPNIQNKYGNTSLNIASNLGYKDIVKILLENGANPNIQNKYGYTPLHNAFDNEYSDIIRILLENGADPNIQDEYGDTPLHNIITSDFIKILLENGADLNIQNKYGYTPLFKAVQGDFSDIVKILLENGADPNIQDENGRYPLTVASNNNSGVLINLLKEYGAKE